MNINNEKLYQVYYSLGPARTLRKVAESTGKGLSTIERISASDNWKQRVLSDNLGRGRDIPGDEATLITFIRTESLSKLYLAIKHLDPRSVRDAKTLLEIFQLVSGRPTAIQGTADARAISDETLEALTPEQQAVLGEIAIMELFGDNPTA